VAIGGLAACGDDDDDTSGPSGTGSEPTESERVLVTMADSASRAWNTPARINNTPAKMLMR
jgi:hypothetical protein